MNRHCSIRIVVSLLVICLVGIGGFASAHSLIHESHHAHHEQTTHGTVLCSWTCMAGQVIDDVVVPHLVELTPVDRAEVGFFHSPSFIALHEATSRGPPALSPASF